MKAWVLNHNLRDEATWYRAWQMALQLRRAGYDVDFFTVHPQRRFCEVRRIEEGVTVHETPYLGSRRMAASGLDGWDILWRTAMVLTGAWDLLYGFSSLPNVSLPFLVARKYRGGRRFVSDWDDLFTDGGVYENLNRGVTILIYRAERWLEQAVRKQADGVTATSQYLVKKARALRSDGRVLYMPAGTAVADIPVLPKEEARQRIPVPPHRIIFCHLSSGFHEDSLMLLEALALALRRRTDLHLLFIGSGQSRARETISRLGIGAAISIIERIPFRDVPWYLAAADVLVMPLYDCPNSRARGPIKLKDYMCAGRPIVGTALGEVEYWLGRYPVGLLADLSPQSFADRMIEMAGNPVGMESMGREARRVAEEVLAWDIIGKNFIREMEGWFS